MSKCCICGKEIKDEILEGNNPDPLKDENGKFLADDPKYNVCCHDCNHLYVISFRICQIYGLKEQCDLIQKKVLELRKSWLNEEKQDGNNDR